MYVCSLMQNQQQIVDKQSVIYTANVYRQTTDKLFFKSVISTQRYVPVFLKTFVCCFNSMYAAGYKL